MKALVLLFFTALAVRAAGPGGAAPATVTKEGGLVVLTLKPEAEQSLRLQTAAVAKRAIPSTRLFSGEVVTPLGAEGQAVAPVLGGTLDEVLRLAELQAAAEGRVREAQVQIDAAKIALERAEKMLIAEAGSVRSVDEAKAALALAEAAMITAQAQRALLGAAVGEAGARRSWVRVSIYSGEAEILDPKAAASIRPLGGGKPLSALPVPGPPTANAAAGTVDWYYALPAEAGLRAGGRVAVEIPTLEDKKESLVLPFKAVLYDIHGGQWVYEKTGAHTYTRRRVQVARVAGSDAVLASGPPAGTEIVTDGAAELFGTEFMTGK
mgnify:CR=1 FL=1